MNMFLKQTVIIVASIIFLLLIPSNVEASRDIAFVIDDTASMVSEINQIKNNIHSTFKGVLESNDYNIDKIIIITFNDNEVFSRSRRKFYFDLDMEVVKTRASTKDIEKLYASLDEVIARGGGRCPEQALKGIERALEECSDYSYIYVFTDASPSDSYKEEAIAALARNKSIQINFFVTGKCQPLDDYSVYERLAKNSSGEIFRVREDDIDQMMKFLNYSMKDVKINLLSEKISGDKTFTFTVDEVDELYIAANGFKTGHTVDVKLTDLSGNDAPTTALVETNNTKIYSMQNPFKGTYTLNVNSTSEGTVTVVSLINGLQK